MTLLYIEVHAATLMPLLWAQPLGVTGEQRRSSNVAQLQEQHDYSLKTWPGN